MDTVTQQEAMELVKTYGTQAAAAAFLNMSKSAFGRLLHTGSTSGKNYSANKQVTKGTTPMALKGKKTLNDFRNLYDKDTIVPSKIKEALNKLKATSKDEEDGWEYEVQFAKDAGVSISDIGNYREMFSEYVVFIKRENKRVWAATPKLASTITAMVS